MVKNKEIKRKKLFAVVVIICSGLALLCLFFGWFRLRFLLPQVPDKREPTGRIISGNFDPSKTKSDAEWKSMLTPEQYHILREEGTEIPFTGTLLGEKRKGTYVSVGCEQPVFRSENKFESGTGWPSFWAPITPEAVVLREDNSLGATRVEVLDVCGGHLGHVFDDGPEPTGKRYCMNSAALKFVPDPE